MSIVMDTGSEWVKAPFWKSVHVRISFSTLGEPWSEVTALDSNIWKRNKTAEKNNIVLRCYV